MLVLYIDGAGTVYNSHVTWFRRISFLQRWNMHSYHSLNFPKHPVWWLLVLCEVAVLQRTLWGNVLVSSLASQGVSAFYPCTAQCFRTLVLVGSKTNSVCHLDDLRTHVQTHSLSPGEVRELVSQSIPVYDQWMEQRGRGGPSHSL